MSHATITLDMRPDFRAGLHPCDKIQAALQRVTDGDTLRWLVRSGPRRLVEVAGSKGVDDQSRQLASGDREVLFAHSETTAQQAEREPCGCGCGCNAAEISEVVELDARGV